MQTAACRNRAEVSGIADDLVPVSGVITFQKKPLPGAAVTFFPTGNDAVRAAYGLTDESGKYELMTPISGVSTEKSMGAVPGTYQVIISQLVNADGSPVPKGVTTADAIEKGARESLPPKFSNDLQSVLKAEIQKGVPRTDLNFDL